MPTKIFYNLDSIRSPRADPKKLIVAGPSDKNRVSRDRAKLNTDTHSLKRKLLIQISLAFQSLEMQLYFHSEINKKYLSSVCQNSGL